MQEQVKFVFGDYEVLLRPSSWPEVWYKGELWPSQSWDSSPIAELIGNLVQEVRRLQKALSDSALTALAAETQADEAYQKQLAAEKRVKELEAELESAK